MTSLLSTRRALIVFLVVGAAATACGSSSSKTSSASGSSATTAASSGGITVSAANVPGVGMVLVNGDGRTLYLLTSEQGGKITCTDSNGCTKVWPDTELPKGVTAATAGPGIDASKLSTVKDASGSLYVTYGGWPLYTYSGDTGSGKANGQGIQSFGGQWWVISPAGTAVTTSASSSGGSGSSGSGGGSSGGSGGSSSGGGGYGY